MSSIVSADVTVTPAAVPSNLHIYNEYGDTYVDHAMHECASVRYRIDPNHVKYDATISLQV